MCIITTVIFKICVLIFEGSNPFPCTILYILLEFFDHALVAQLVERHLNKVEVGDSNRLSNTMDTDFCASALEEAVAKYGKPDIFNTDQGSQFTSFAFTTILRDKRIRI